MTHTYMTIELHLSSAYKVNKFREFKNLKKICEVLICRICQLNWNNQQEKCDENIILMQA